MCVLILHKSKFFQPVVQGFVTGGFEGAAVAGLQVLAGDLFGGGGRRQTGPTLAQVRFARKTQEQFDARRRYQESIGAETGLPRRPTGGGLVLDIPPPPHPVHQNRWLRPLKSQPHPIQSAPGHQSGRRL